MINENRYEEFGITYKKLEILKYRLLKQYKIELDLNVDDFELSNSYYNNNILVLKRGFSWDGPSALTIDTAEFMRGSLVHDILYIAIAEGKLPAKHKKLADKILYRLCREDGMSKIRATYVYWAVRLFGKARTKRTF